MSSDLLAPVLRAAALAMALLTLAGAAHAQSSPPVVRAPPTPPTRPAGPLPPKPEAPSEAGGFWNFWDPRTSPFIPIPEVGTDPNSGTTFGILPVFLTTTNGQISRIIAPDLNYNDHLGYGANFRIFSYPSEDKQWSAVVGAKEHVERGFDGVYSTGILRQSDWTFFNHLVYDRSATGRFFGIGNNTPSSNESNYTNEQAYYEFSVGRNFGPSLQVALNVRPRNVTIEEGTFSNVPSTDVLFPQVPGLGTEHDFLTRLFVSYDTRDSTTVPSRGEQIVAYAGITPSVLSSVSYSVFGLDARKFLPLNDRFTLAAHASLRYMPVGSDVPFWALSSLGGDRAVLAEEQPLRGFGSDRFVDRNMFSSSIELRTKIFNLDLFSTNLTFEMAPFIDAGRVFHDMGDSPVGRLHVAGGVGLRGVAKPFIVGYVDVGYGSDGPAVFSGIDYPF